MAMEHSSRILLYILVVGLGFLAVPSRAFSTHCLRCSSTLSSTQLYPLRTSSQPSVYYDEDETNNNNNNNNNNDELDDDLYRNYDDRSSVESRIRQGGTRDGLARYLVRNDREDDDYYDDDDDDEEEDFDEDGDDESIRSPVGNFWSNPTGRMDRIQRPPTSSSSLAPSTVTRRRRMETSYNKDEDNANTPDSQQQQQQQRRRKRSQIKSNGLSQAPEVAKDFYERLFWYGFNPDETADVGDKTVFGGTKGKFDGLAYLQASEDPRRPLRSRKDRQLPPVRTGQRRSEEYDQTEEEEQDDYYNDDEENTAATIRSTPSRYETPPEDLPKFPKSEQEGASRSRRKRPPLKQQRPRPRTDDYDDDDDFAGENWVSKKVSSWFSGTDDDESANVSRQGRRRQQQQQQRSQTGGDWSPFNVLEAFLGLDREEMAFKADMYNAKMGIRSKRSSPAGPSKRQERRLARENPRRPGYAYQFDSEEELDDNEASFIVDVEPIPPADKGSEISAAEKGRNRNGSASKTAIDDDRPNANRELTWEERALAVERVPPADIPAWGPSGELPMDGRTKAILDALEDIQTARQKLEAREKREALAKEEITILKVDAELQRRQLEDARSVSRRAQERLRQIEFDIDDASRALRRARTRVQLARDQLEELKTRHWAVLGYYNPDQAEEMVAEALNEFRLSQSIARPVEEMNGSTDTALQAYTSEQVNLSSPLNVDSASSP